MFQQRAGELKTGVPTVTPISYQYHSGYCVELFLILAAGNTAMGQGNWIHYISIALNF